MNEKELIKFIKLKRLAKFESLEMFASIFCILGAFFSTIFYQSLTVAFLVGTALLLTTCLARKTSKQLIKLIEGIVEKDAESLKKVADIKQH